MPKRLVFMGSPDFALPSLNALANEYQVVGVVTQPDRPAGRGRHLTPPPIKELAERIGLPVIQPKTLKDPVAMEQLQTWRPDLIIVVAFGQILRQVVLDLPVHGCLNIHASLLPRWRGAAPIQAAILHGDIQTGVTIMRMDPGVDTGPILAQHPEPIFPEDTAGSLSARLASLGAELLIETLPGYLRGDVQPIPQDDSFATYAPMIAKGEGRLDFNLSALELTRRVRAFHPWPGTFIEWNGGRLNILQAHPAEFRSDSPGAQVIHDGLPAIATAEGLLILDRVQPAGKKPMQGKEFLRGARDWIT